MDRGRGPIIEELSFTASRGETVLITGCSGAGKSSLLGVLSGEIEPLSGGVFTAGRVVALTQYPYVFRGTVADNMRIANSTASDEELRQVLWLVGLADVLGTDPLCQHLGSGGRSLSGGQARRLATARALIAKPDILLADEPTEGLDADAAAELLLGLRLSDPQMTLVVALHEHHVAQLSGTPNRVVRLDQLALPQTPPNYNGTAPNGRPTQSRQSKGTQ